MNMKKPTFKHVIVKLLKIKLKEKNLRGFPGGSVVRGLPANAGDTGSSPGPGRTHVLQSN